MNIQSVAKNGFAYCEYLADEVSHEIALERFKNDNDVKEETIVSERMNTAANIYYIKAEMKENKETY